MTSSVGRVLYQEDYRKFKMVKKELAAFLASEDLDPANPRLCLLLARNVHSNGTQLYLPLMVAEIVALPGISSHYRVLHHFKHHRDFPFAVRGDGNNVAVSTSISLSTTCQWDLVVPVSHYMNASSRPLGDYSHLTRSQKQKKFNGEKARIAAQEYLETPHLSKTIVATRYGVSLSTLNDAVKRLKRLRELHVDNEGDAQLMDYRTAPDQSARKRVASVALLNVLNSPLSPSKRCRLVPEMSFKYNIPERTLRDRLKSVNPSISKAAEGARRRKLSASTEQFLTTFFAICNVQNTQISVQQADAICELMATTTDCPEIKVFDAKLEENGAVNLTSLLREQETQLGRNFGWRFRQRNGFQSSKAKQMDSRRLKASDVNNIAMWLNEDAFKILSSTPPELIFNADEIGFAHTVNSSNQHSRYVSFTNAKKKHSKNVIYKVKETEADPKTLTTVTACVSAAGGIVPPMVTAASSIAKHKTECHTLNPRFETLAKSKLYPGVNENVFLVFTSNGWNNSNAFFEYVKWFDAHTTHLAQSPDTDDQLRQRVLIVDNHYSHYCKSVLDYVTSRRITLLLLPPNTTHVLQPLDVGVFSNLKKKVRSLATEWCPSPSMGPDGKLRYGHFDILTNFMNALNQTLLHDFEQSKIAQAFVTAGIYPPEKSLFNPAVRTVMKHFDAHANMKDIFLRNILPITQCNNKPRTRTIAGATATTLPENPPSPLVPLIRDEAFFIGENDLESLSFLSVNAQELIDGVNDEQESCPDSDTEFSSSQNSEGDSMSQSSLNHDFVSQFTFEDVLKLVKDLIGGREGTEGVSLVPKLMERLDKCSKIAFSDGKHLTITKELFLEQQSNVLGIIMYLIYFGACFLGMREQNKIEEILHTYETGQRAGGPPNSQAEIKSTTDVLRDLSKKQFFKLFPAVSGSIDRDLAQKIALLQNNTHDPNSMSETLVNELGLSVWEFLQGMLKNENSVLSSQPEELKSRVLSQALEAPEALAKAATIRSMFDHNGSAPFSKKDLPIVSKIESIGAIPEQLLDPNISDEQFAHQVSILRHAATAALQDIADLHESSDDLDDDTTLTSTNPFVCEDRGRKIAQNWFLVYHIDNVVGRISSTRENSQLKTENRRLEAENLRYQKKIDALTQAISDMANNVRSSTAQTLFDAPDPFFDLGLVEGATF